MQNGDVVIVSSDELITRMVREAIEARGGDPGAHVFDELDELATRLERQRSIAVIVDIDPDPEALLTRLQPMIDRYLSTRFIVIASEMRNALMLRAMQVGARDFLVKEVFTDTLEDVLDQFGPAGPEADGGAGCVVTVLSAGGGCGATTIAVNLARELHALDPSGTLIIDLDLVHGGVAGYLGLKAIYGLADVLADGDRIDTHLIRSTAVAAGEALHVLASPATTDPDRVSQTMLEHLPRALRSARRGFAHTVIDAPNAHPDLIAALGRSSDAVLIVMEMNVDDVRIARAQMARLADAGVASAAVCPVLSRARARKAMITFAEIQKALGHDRPRQIRNDFKSAVTCINYGKPLAETAPRSRLRRDVQALTRSVLAITAEAGR